MTSRKDSSLHFLVLYFSPVMEIQGTDAHSGYHRFCIRFVVGLPCSRMVETLEYSQVLNIINY